MIMLVILASCNTTKHLDKVIKKYGVKETIEHITETYPEYFNKKVDDIVIFSTDTVYIPAKDGVVVSTVIHDTIFFKDKNVEIAVNKNTGKGHYKLPSNNVIKHDTIHVPVVTNCPDIAIQNDKIKSLELKHIKYKNKTSITIIIETFLLLLALIYFIIKLLK